MPRRDVPETRYALSGDVNIAYQVFGEGERDLVYVPGLLTNIELAWDSPDQAAFMTALAAHFRVIVFDKRGQGSSDPLDGSQSLEERMDDLRAVMDAAGSQRAVIFGLSEGSPMSALFAATYPDRVEHLVLLGGYAVGPTLEQGYAGPGLEERLARLRAAWATESIVAHLAPSRANDADFVNDMIRFMRQTASPGAIVRIAEANDRIDVRAILPSIITPTLVVHCRGDRQVTVERGQKFARLIPGAAYLELAADDHLPWACDWTLLVNALCHLTLETTTPTPGRRVATALFTDIEGSTEHLSKVGDAAWRQMLDRHDALVRDLVRHHRGRFVKSTGDGCLAVFDGPTRAIHCARTLVGQLAEIGLSIRAGLHAGEIEPRQDDVTGLAVHIAARVLEQARGGEVLVSRTVMDLTAGSDLAFEAAGTRRLKGVAGDVELYRPV